MNLADLLKNIFGSMTSSSYQYKRDTQGNLSPSSTASVPSPQLTQVPQATPIPTQAPGGDRQKMIDAYTEGFKHWGSPPAATLSALMVDEAQKYPIFQKYPWLPAALTILESGGGKNLTKREDVSPAHRQFNLTNWGVNLPQGYYEPTGPEDVLQKTISGIGSRMGAYEPFRTSGNLQDFANVYAPSSDNPGTGGSDYARNAQSIMDIFQKAYDQKGR